jgi:signal transduction histidine kinase
MFSKEKHSKVFLFLIGLLACLVVEGIDYVTGFEIEISIFYLFVVMYFGWFIGPLTGIVAAVVLGPLSVVTDVLEGMPYSHVAIPFWIAVMRLSIFLIVAVILAQLRNREEKLQEAIKDLKQSNAELDYFTSMVSHDLRTPLNTIGMFTELLEKSSAAYEGKGKDYIPYIKKSVANMQQLIADLLSYAKMTKSEQHYEKIDLKALIEELTIDLQALIREKNPQIDVEPLPTVYANPLQMRQLFQNLLGNALKYSREQEPPRVKISSQQERDSVNIYVEDNGTGFDEEYAEKIFMPFQRLHTSVDGTGMGLPICRKIVKQYGGEITAKSRLNQGSTFIVKLPRALTESSSGNIR